jgi:hypothetical protein
MTVYSEVIDVNTAGAQVFLELHRLVEIALDGSGTLYSITHVPFSRSPHGGVWSVRPPVDRCA